MSQLLPNLFYETQLGFPKLKIAGLDEVGRGCLAGPVVAAAVVLPTDAADQWKAARRSRSPKHPFRFLREIDDSKKLSEKAREALSPLIQEWALSWAIGSASVAEIDTLNILNASHLAMQRALDALHQKPDHLLVDGKLIPKFIPPTPTCAIIGGDAKCLSIAAASILAKVYRDRLMNDMEGHYPGYGFAKHKGYGTAAHLGAMAELGVTEIHRRSFKPCQSPIALRPIRTEIGPISGI